MNYIWFWMAKTIAEIGLFLGFIAIVALAVFITALWMTVRNGWKKS